MRPVPAESSTRSGTGGTIREEPSPMGCTSSESRPIPAIRNSARYWCSSNMTSIVTGLIRKTAFSLLGIVACAGLSRAQIAGSAGSFARMGSGARGMGMGNAMTAVNFGDLQTYYNPALAAFSDSRTAGATFGLLSLDRYLNFVSYVQPIHPTAGISFGIINAGVRNIDGRDADGEKTGDLSTFENQFFLAFANRVADRLSL